MATSTKIKILIGISVVAITLGANIPRPRLSIAMLLLGVTSGSSFLLISPKPWERTRRRCDRINSLRTRFQKQRHELKALNSRLTTTDTLFELEQKCLGQKEVLEVMKLDAQRVIEAKVKKAEQLTQEVNELQELADDIAQNSEREARIKAAALVSEAEATAAKIIKATQENLEVTVFAPERLAHEQRLGQIQIQKENMLAEIEYSRSEGIAQLERLQALQNKTREAIEKMKVAAQAEHAAIKEKLKKQAQQQFMKEMERIQQVVEQLENQIKLLTTENQMLRSELDSLDEPKYPEGYSDHEIYSRGIIDFYKQLGVKLDYKLSFKEGDRIVCRYIPREEKVGEQQLRKFSDRLQRKFDLLDLPQIVTTSGTLQFSLQLREIQTITPEVRDVVMHVAQSYDSGNVPVLSGARHPELEELRTHFERAQQREFIPPTTRFSPFEPLTQTERDWVLWLWNICRIQEQNLVINTVWRNTRGKGVTQGIGQSYQRARDKLHQILDEAGIHRRKANNNEE